MVDCETEVQAMPFLGTEGCRDRGKHGVEAMTCRNGDNMRRCGGTWRQQPLHLGCWQSGACERCEWQLTLGCKVTLALDLHSIGITYGERPDWEAWHNEGTITVLRQQPDVAKPCYKWQMVWNLTLHGTCFVQQCLRLCSKARKGASCGARAYEVVLSCCCTLVALPLPAGIASPRRCCLFQRWRSSTHRGGAGGALSAASVPPRRDISRMNGCVERRSIWEGLSRRVVQASRLCSPNRIYPDALAKYCQALQRQVPEIMR